MDCAAPHLSLYGTYLDRRGFKRTTHAVFLQHQRLSCSLSWRRTQNPTELLLLENRQKVVRVQWRACDLSSLPTHYCVQPFTHMHYAIYLKPERGKAKDKLSTDTTRRILYGKRNCNEVFPNLTAYPPHTTTTTHTHLLCVFLWNVILFFISLNKLIKAKDQKGQRSCV